MTESTMTAMVMQRALNPEPQEAPARAIGDSDLLLTPFAAQLSRIERLIEVTLQNSSNKSILAGRIMSLLEERRQERKPLELEWLDNIRRYNNQYSPDIAARLASEPNRSKVFVGFTRMKCDAAIADLLEVWRGNGEERPWSIKPPEIDDDTPVPPEWAAQGVTLDDIRKEAKKRARGMTTEITNQLEACDFDEILALAAYEYVVLGTLGTKGPFTVPDESGRWGTGADEGGMMLWQFFKNGGFRPEVKYVSILNLYPPMDQTTPTDMIEEMDYSRADIIKLAMQPGFQPQAILKVLKESPTGNYTPPEHVVSLRAIAGDTMAYVRKNRWLVVCYYGEVTGQELRDIGEEVPEEALDMMIIAEIWVCGGYVIKAQKHNGKIPYNMAPNRRRGNMPFGTGTPKIIANSQDAVNGSTRIMMDNAAIASGPIVEVNRNLLEMNPGDDPSDIHAWKVYISDHDGNNGKRAITITDIPAYTNQFLLIVDSFRRWMDDESGQSSITHGNQIAGTTKTATGMSILNSNSGKIRNHSILTVDDRVIEPLVEAFYDWNMRFSQKLHILIPATVEVRGANSIMAKEMESQRLLMAAQTFMGHPQLRDGDLMRQFFRTLGLSAGEYVESDEEAKRKMMEQQATELEQNGTGGAKPKASPRETPVGPGAPPAQFPQMG